jgi:TRAP-type mannitol/chloroaromatic compound transport system permease small subunit
MVLVSATNAVMRKAFDSSSNAWLELQWYMFSAVFLLCAGYVALNNENIRIDILTSRLSRSARNRIDVFGHALFLLPFCAVMLYENWPYFWDSLLSGERSSNAGGLLRWPVKVLMVAGFALLFAQALSELVKRIAELRGSDPRPPQPADSEQSP